MTRYARIDNNAPWNPKIQALNDAEFRAFFSSICYADQFTTDGYIPSHALRVVGGSKRIIEALVAKGFWEQNGTGIHVHDYLEHQRSKAQIEAAVEKARKAGKGNTK